MSNQKSGHISTNDIGRKREEVLQNEYREIGKRLKCRTSRVIISGLLPLHVLVDKTDECMAEELAQGTGIQTFGPLGSL